MRKLDSSSIKIFFITLKTNFKKYLAITDKFIETCVFIIIDFWAKGFNNILKYILEHRYYHWLIVEIFFGLLLFMGIIIGNYMPFNLYGGINAIMLTFFIRKIISYKSIAKLFSNYRKYAGKEKHINRMNIILKTFSLYEKVTLVTSGFTFGVFFSLFFRLQERFWETLPFLELYTIS